MRVLAVIDSLEQGGAERSLVDLVPHLARLGVQVDIATVRDPGFLADEAARSGAEVIGLGGRGRPDTVRRLRALVASRRPDLVHTSLYEANVAGRIAGASARVPVVSSLVNTPYDPEHLHGEGVAAAKVRAAQAVDAATARLVTRFHATSREVATVMRRRLALGTIPVEVVPRGRDPLALGEPSPERRAHVRRSLGLTDHDWCVLAVARHEPAKGLDVLLGAATRLPAALADRTVVLVAGRDGRSTAALRSSIAAAGPAPQVRLLGARDDVPDLLAACDVMAMSSRREGYPGAAIEAMALAVPIVATAVPGTVEALGPGVGVIVPIDDAGALAAGLASVAAHPAAAAARARVGRARFLERSTTAAVAAAMAGLYARAARPR